MIKMLFITIAALASGSAIAYEATGHASWYGPGFHGKKTASGSRFNRNALTAAHKTLPLNSKAMVTNLETNESVVVTINDRGPHGRGRLIDLSQAAAKAIGIRGVGKVLVTALEDSDLEPTKVFED
ncbi:MAG TPA: septal ring lytic transglycosylase RlpA family lipoprotein [Methylococcaceae bacterium]|jgi:rare lipoprotein A|nr:septal ring lytic transglycosylase RlpA family lipoprotein [Methylococcaceae bacterium]